VKKGVNMFKKINIYYIVGLIFIFFVSVACAQNKETKASDSDKQYSAKTQLSKKAMHLHVGMTKHEVIKLLGKPTWGDGYKGVSLVLSWKNGHCNPVEVIFNKNMKVNGYNEGRAECLTVAYIDLPSNKTLCSNHDHAKFCV